MLERLKGLERLRNLFGKVDAAALTQPQREALIDLLLWTMYVDRMLALSENDRIDQLPEELSWESVTPFPTYLNASFARVREVLSDEDEARKLLDDIYARLGTDAARRRAYDACLDLADIDGQVAEEERRFLEGVRMRFGLDAGEPGAPLGSHRVGVVHAVDNPAGHVEELAAGRDG